MTLRKSFVLAVTFFLTMPSAEGEVPNQNVQRAVQRGLDFLARTQQVDGAWPGQKGDSPAVVGLVILSFLGSGEIPGRSAYDPTLKLSINYILSAARSDGFIGLDRSPSMYDHGFATLALAELYGVYPDSRIGPALDRAVRLITRCQNDEGGWRYKPEKADADITVTGCQMMALRAARNAGIDVPERTIRRGLDYLKSCQQENGGFAYQSEREAVNLARTGIGVVTLILGGEAESDRVRRGAEFLDCHTPSTEERHFYYMMYYCAQAAFQLGEESWARWQRVGEPLVLSQQTESGGWPSGVACQAYTTAMALLALEPSWQYLPIFQR